MSRKVYGHRKNSRMRVKTLVLTAKAIKPVFVIAKVRTALREAYRQAVQP